MIERWGDALVRDSAFCPNFTLDESDESGPMGYTREQFVLAFPLRVPRWAE